MTTKLYTAAEARRIDIERGGEGVICSRTGELKYRLDEVAVVWCSKDRQCCLLVPEAAIAQQWLPVTPEPEQLWSDKSQSELKIEQLEKENESLLAERNRLREWYEDYYTKQPTIEQLEKELAEIKKERDNDIYYRLYTDAQKQRDEYKDHYHEILADHGELTQKFDELKEKQRWKSCKDEKPENMFEAMLEGRTIKTWRGIAKQLEKELAEREKTINIQKQTISNREQELDKLKWKQRRKSCKGEKPTTNQKIIFLDGNSMLQRGQYIPLHSQWYLHVGEDHYIALASSTVENWNWKYEADL